MFNRTAVSRFRTLRVETMENRQLLSISPFGSQGIVVTEPLPDATVQAGDEVPAAQTSFYSSGWGSSLLGVRYPMETVFDLQGSSAVLMGDLIGSDGFYGRPDGVYETPLGVDNDLKDGSVDFDLSHTEVALGGTGLRTQVQLTIGEDATDGVIQLGKPRADVAQGFYWGRSKISTIVVGCENPIITVESGNQWPLAMDDSATINSGGSIAFDIHQNDWDPDGYLDLSKTRFGVTVADPPGEWGSWSYSHTDGMFQFNSNPSYSGTVVIPYTVFDNDGAADDAAITIEVEERAKLSVVSKSTGSTDTAVSHQEIILYRFEVAAEGADALLTSSTFDVVQGHPYNVYEYELWVDSDSDSVVDTRLDGAIANANLGTVTFDNIVGGYVLPQDLVTVFEIRGDVASSLSEPLSLQLELSGVEAEKLDDGSAILPDNVTYVTEPGILWNFVPQGDLYVTMDSTPVPNHQYLGGTLGEPALRLQVRAENEAIDVTYIGFDISGDSTSISRIELWIPGESAPFAFATSAGGHVGDDFGVTMSSQQFVVGKGDNTDILVRPCMKTDMEGGISGDSFSVSLGEVEARGFTSSRNLLPNDGDSLAEGEVFIGTSTAGPNQPIDGRVNDVVMANIVAITNASTDPDGTAVPWQESDIGAFKFSAGMHENFQDGSNDAVLDGIVFSVQATNVKLDRLGFGLYNQADQSMAVGHSGVYSMDGTLLTDPTVTGSFLVMFDGLAASSIDTDIDRGEDITLVLAGNVTETNISTTGEPSSLVVFLQRFNSRERTVFGVVGSTTSNISWLDKDFAGSTRSNWIEYSESKIRSTWYIDGGVLANSPEVIDIVVEDFEPEAPLAEPYLPHVFTWSQVTAKRKAELAATDSVFEMMYL